MRGMIIVHNMRAWPNQLERVVNYRDQGGYKLRSVTQEIKRDQEMEYINVHMAYDLYNSRRNSQEDGHKHIDNVKDNFEI